MDTIFLYMSFFLTKISKNLLIIFCSLSLLFLLLLLLLFHFYKLCYDITQQQRADVCSKTLTHQQTSGGSNLWFACISCNPKISGNSLAQRHVIYFWSGRGRTGQHLDLSWFPEFRSNHLHIQRSKNNRREAQQVFAFPHSIPQLLWFIFIVLF